MIVVVLHVQNFLDKLPLNLVLFYNCNIVTWLLQSENVLQLIINLFMFAPISWYKNILGCKPPLIEKFCYKMYYKHLPWYIKVSHILKIVKLLSQIVYIVVCFYPPNSKLYIFHQIPSQHVSPKPIVVLVKIDHQMVVIHV